MGSSACSVLSHELGLWGDERVTVHLGQARSGLCSKELFILAAACPNTVPTLKFDPTLEPAPHPYPGCPSKVTNGHLSTELRVQSLERNLCTAV